MAQTNQNNTLWAESAARCRYAVVNGSPIIGVSGNGDTGFIVPVPAPTWFHTIGDEGQRDNVFRGMTSHALRIGQAKLKSADSETRDVAEAAVNSAIDGTYKSSRETTNDVVDTETARRFAAEIRTRVLAVKADATDAQIEAMVAKKSGESDGKAMLANLRAAVLESRVYTINKKGKSNAKIDDLSITL
jgi:hypothetical protein